METEVAVSSKGFRFQSEVISHAVWLYHCFPLSFRESRNCCWAAGLSSPRDDPVLV